MVLLDHLIAVWTTFLSPPPKQGPCGASVYSSQHLEKRTVYRRYTPTLWRTATFVCAHARTCTRAPILSGIKSFPAPSPYLSFSSISSSSSLSLDGWALKVNEGFFIKTRLAARLLRLWVKKKKKKRKKNHHTLCAAATVINSVTPGLVRLLLQLTDSIWFIDLPAVSPLVSFGCTAWLFKQKLWQMNWSYIKALHVSFLCCATQQPT